MDGSITLFFDLFGTAVFAITGAVKGIRNRLDLLGVIFFAITVGCGGGMIRDVLIGATPVAAFMDPRYFLVCIAAAILCFLFAPKTVGRWSIIQYGDAIGLGVFTALGVSKAAMLGVGVIGQVMSGMFAAVGGGILRDVFSREIPAVFTSDFYATASILGALFYCMMRVTHAVDDNVLFVLTAVATTLLRVIAIRHNFKLPVAKMHGE